MGGNTLEIMLVVDSLPRGGQCLSHWDAVPLGYRTAGKENLACLDEVTSKSAVSMIEWRLILATMTPNPDYPETDIAGPMRNMLRFEHYYIQAVTAVTLGHHIPKSIPLGQLDLEGVPQKVTGEVNVIDPFVIRGRESGSVLVRTKVQLRHDREFVLGLGRQDERELSMLSARYRQVGHG